MPEQAKRHRAVVLAVALASVLAARATGAFALGGFAHVMDEIAYLFQAKIFAGGHLTAPIIEPRAAFTTWFIEDQKARFGIFPPGWPAVLAIAVRLGVVHWINPVLHGATVVLVGRSGECLAPPVGAQLHPHGPRDPWLGTIAATLYAASPQTVLMASTLMSHTLVALAAAVLLLLFARLIAESEAPRGLVIASGICLGLAAATRPLCATALGGATIVAFVLFGRRELKTLGPKALLLVACALPFVVGLGLFNHATTGSALRFPQTAYFEEHLPPANLPYFHFGKGCNDLGFGPSHGCDLTASTANHTIANAASNLGDNLTVWLLLATSPLLAIAPVIALARRSTRKSAAFLVAIPIALFALYSLYWHGGTCFGARFYHAALPATVLVVAMGLDLRERRIGASLFACVLLWNGFAFTRVVRELSDPEWGYWGVDDRYKRLREQWHEGKAVVMVAFGGDDIRNPALGWTAKVPTGGMWMLSIRANGALSENPPHVDDSNVVFAKFHPALVGRLRERFPDRTLWLFVANADRARDTLELWNEARFDAKAYRNPVDNFDGFRVEPPLREPPWFFVPDPSPDLLNRDREP